MRRFFFLFLFLFALLFSNTPPTQALIPPATEEELRNDADLIVIGKVVSTNAVGPTTTDNCYVWQNYTSTFAIKTKSGAPIRNVTIVYKHIERDKEEKRPCSGGGDSYYLTPGQFYKLYLQKTKNGPPDEYEPFHWSGILAR